MAYETALLVGRLLFGGYFAFSGLNHFLMSDQLAGWVESKGIPLPELAVYFSGLVLLGGGLGLALGILPGLSVLGIGIFLSMVTPLFHDFWNFEGEERQNHLNDFTKNLGLMGGLLMTLSLNWEVYSLAVTVLV